MDLILDVNTQIYPIDLGMTLSDVVTVRQHFAAVLTSLASD